jgi:hypothetical protein
MQEFEVNCVDVLTKYPREHVTYIGNSNVGWRMAKETAIRRIEEKKEAYYTVDRTTGRRAYVGVIRSDTEKGPYLRTYADGKWNDNLLRQPDCPLGLNLIT